MVAGRNPSWLKLEIKRQLAVVLTKRSFNIFSFFRFRSFFFGRFRSVFSDFFVKFQISIGHGWGGRHGRTERHGRAPAVANWNLKFLKLGIESSETAEARPKPIRNGPKTVRNRPKPSENNPKPSETVRNRSKPFETVWTRFWMKVLFGLIY